MMDRLRLEVARAARPLAWVVVITFFGVLVGYQILSNLTLHLPWQSRYVVRVAVSDAKGITPGPQVVRMAGVQVGTVKDLELVGGQPVLTLSLEPQYAPLYRDARFRIRPLTPLNDLFVSIESRGHPSAGTLDQSQIASADQTLAPVDVSRVLNIFQPDTRNAMSVTLNELARGAPDNGANLRAAFTQLAPFLVVADQTTRVIDDRRVLAKRAMHNFAGIVDALGQRDRQLADLVRGGDASLAELARNDAPFADTLKQLPPTMTEARSAFTSLRSSEDQLDPALQSLRPVAARLAGGLDALQTLAGAANPALDRLQPALRDLVPLTQQLRPTASSLDSAVLRLTPQAPRLDRITAQLPPCFSSISQFFQNTLSVFKFYDAFGSIPRGDNTTDASSYGGTGTATLRHYRSCTGNPNG